MSIYTDNRKKRYRFEFNLTVNKRRIRKTRLLPKGWTLAQAQRYDQEECARLYERATVLDPDLGRSPTADPVRTDHPGVPVRPAPSAAAHTTPRAQCATMAPMVSVAVNLYLRDKKELKSYASVVDHFRAIEGYIHDQPMAELGAISRRIAEAPWSAATKRNRIGLLKAACRWAWARHDLTHEDPTVRMIMPRVRNERHVYASRQEVLKIARAAHGLNPDVRRMVLLAFYTGMRAGELRCASVINGLIVMADTKNGQRRAIPIHPRIRHLADCLPLRTPRSTLQRGFEISRRRAGLEHVRIHDLRHSAASEMVNHGVDLATVGVILGHRDVRSTRRYAHLTAKSLAKAVATIGTAC